LTAVLKGPYYRQIGKHTERFCRRVSKQTKNPKAKGILLLAAISADELVGSLLGYSTKRQVTPFSQRMRSQAIAAKDMASLLRSYISIILTLLTPYKTVILEQTQLNEPDFIKLWCSVFQYGSADMMLFDSRYLPTFQSQGFAGLLAIASQQLVQGLYADSADCTAAELEVLQKVLVDDVAAILRSLDYRPDQ
jgi:hypothetical protein